MAPGDHGHVGFGETCKLDRDGKRVCLTGINPGGSWDRTYVDIWMLSSVDDIVRYGETTFLRAVSLRAAWSLPEHNFYGEVLPHRENNWEIWSIMVKMLHQLIDVMAAKLV